MGTQPHHTQPHHTQPHTHTHTHTHTQQRKQHQQHANNSVTIKKSSTLWSITAKNTDWSTGPLARPFARSLTLLTRSLAPDCSLCSCPPLRSLVLSLTHFAHSLARGTVNDWMAILSVFFSIFDHSVAEALEG